MPRPEKLQAVIEIKDRIERSQAVFLAEYAGLSVKEQQTLRRSLRKSGAEFRVVKMTLARLATAELELDVLEELLVGPTGVAFADEDAATAAKALKEFAKTHEVFSIKGGILGDEFLTPERISQLADIESREVLLAKIAGAAKAPLANMAALLAALPRNAANAFQQLLERLPEDDPDAVTAEGAPEDSPPDTPADEVAPAGDEIAVPEAGTDDDEGSDDEAAEAEDTRTPDENDDDEAAKPAEEE